MSLSPITCTACGKSHLGVRKLVALPHNINICDECINLCVEIVHEDLDNSGLATIAATELAELRRKAFEADMAKIWINSVRQSVARADEEITRRSTDTKTAAPQTRDQS